MVYWYPFFLFLFLFLSIKDNGFYKGNNSFQLGNGNHNVHVTTTIIMSNFIATIGREKGDNDKGSCRGFLYEGGRVDVRLNIPW